MNHAKLLFHMKRALVDEVSAETDEKQRIDNVRRILETGSHDAAVAELFRFFEFECSWENLDCEPSEQLISTGDIAFRCDADNTRLEVSAGEGFRVTAWISFAVEVKDGSTPEILSNWLEENAGWSCCYVGPWEYVDSDGDNLFLVEWNGSPTD